MYRQFVHTELRMWYLAREKHFAEAWLSEHNLTVLAQAFTLKLDWGGNWLTLLLFDRSCDEAELALDHVRIVHDGDERPALVSAQRLSQARVWPVAILSTLEKIGQVCHHE